MRTCIDKEPLVGLLGGILPLAPRFQRDPRRTRQSPLMVPRTSVVPNDSPVAEREAGDDDLGFRNVPEGVFDRLAPSSPLGLFFTPCVSRVALEDGAFRSCHLQPPRSAASFLELPL